MHTNRHTAKDLAQNVFSELKVRKLAHPSLSILRSLFESLYSASLHSEESRPITFDIVYLNPKDPDPKPPPRIRLSRWRCARLSNRLPLTTANLIKLSKASDPRTSSLAVYHDESHQLYLWGLVDHGVGYYDFVNYDADQGPARAGLFQVEVRGAGHLMVSVDYERITELRIDTLILKALDVLHSGPIGEGLTPGIQVYLDKVATSLPASLIQTFTDWKGFLTFEWISTLQRLLLRIQTYRHGGAFLISPESSSTGLNIKYKLHYKRLQTATATRAGLTIRRCHAMDTAWQHIQSDANDMPIKVYLDESITEDEKRDSDNEVDGAIWFVSLLTRVDGLVLMDPNLAVRGFGTEITFDDAPARVFIAGDRDGSKTLLRRADYNHYGTRHRSMMRYCARVPGSIGFVVSQDGDVRIMTLIGGHLVMWENIKLQLPDFVNQSHPLKVTHTRTRKTHSGKRMGKIH